MSQLIEEAIRLSLQDQKRVVLGDLRQEIARRNSKEALDVPAPTEVPVASAPAAAAPTVARSDSGDDWTSVEVDVVVPELSNVDAQIAGDAVLARACELMGSALFSDEGEVQGEVQDEVEDDSKPSAAATTPAQLSLYSSQLSSLTTLGLVDRYGLKVCVEILDRLTAANIGSDESKAVTVDQVIHELLKQEA